VVRRRAGFELSTFRVRRGPAPFANWARLGSLVLLAVLVAGPAQAATWTVDTTGDGADISIGDGTCRTSGGPPRCTLRAAIQEANALAGLDTIDFNIAPAGAQTIALLSNLPTITSPVTIDGTTQPGFGGSPVIELNGTSGGTTLDLRAGSDGSTIRGLCINRSPSNAIRILGSSNNVIAGNFLGTNLAGTAPGPGNFVGVYVGGSGGASNLNRVGGTALADRNVISGNTNDGVQINGVPGTANGNLVQGNYIGVDVTGTLDLGNTNQGVAIFGTTNANNVIGGTTLGAGNVISGNNDRGVMISSAGTTGTLVQGNKIGTNAAGTAGIPNNTGGVRFDAGTSNNMVGGTVAGADNLIAYNGLSGIWFTATAGGGTAILGNRIHSNVVLGIDLGDDGVTANDLGDTDPGPNNRQNFPVLSAAMTDGLGTFANFAGSLDGAPSTAYRIEFFASSAVDLPCCGEGQRYLSFTNVTTNAAGYATIGVTLPVALTAGEFVTATATDPSNNTSEFSAAVVAYGSLIVTTTADNVNGTTTSVAALIANPGDGYISLREAITATNATAGTDTVRFGIPLTDANHLYYQNDAIAGSLSSVQVTTLADSPSPASTCV